MNIPTHMFDGAEHINYNPTYYDNMSVVYHIIKNDRRHQIVGTYSTSTHLLNLYIDVEHAATVVCDKKSFDKLFHNICVLDHVYDMRIYHRMLSKDDMIMLYDHKERSMKRKTNIFGHVICDHACPAYYNSPDSGDVCNAGLGYFGRIAPIDGVTQFGQLCALPSRFTLTVNEDENNE